MASKLNPYLSFRDTARQAMEFYHSVFGGKLDMRTFKDFHASQDPREDAMIMHAMLETEDGMTLMASDTPLRNEYQPGTRFSLSLSGDDEDKLTQYFNKLSSGGKVTMPLEKAMWGDTFGMCIDSFGVPWMVSISAKKV